MLIFKVLAVSVMSFALMGQTKAPDALAQAREFYNAQQYDDAIRLAREARTIPAFEPAATMVFARALLERYRQTSQEADLDLARNALKRIDAESLGARDQVELTIALGISLYLDQSYNFDDRFSAAAEQFELALARADLLDARSRDQLFDWWAGSLDRQAQQGSEAARRPIASRRAPNRNWRTTVTRRLRPTGWRPRRVAWATSRARWARPWPAGCAPLHSARAATRCVSISNV
jgi:hypothetical protein